MTGQGGDRGTLVTDVVQGPARPDEVGAAEGVEPGRDLGELGVDPVTEGEAAGPVTGPLQKRFGGIHRHHLRVGEGAGQQTLTTPGPLPMSSTLRTPPVPVPAAPVAASRSQAAACS